MPADQQIVRAAIHPAIGIARVGNSDGYYFGPEVTDPPPAKPGSRKDGSGALKREAARFRIYGYNAAGEVVGELTAKDAEIHWTVHVANRKAAWYQFQLALDIPEAASADPSNRRNATVRDRSQLVIDPGPRTITGPGQEGGQYRFESGEFFGKPVYLGELRTDDRGRLLFLGGHGHSASYTGAEAVTFANNDGWHDDTSDGPVTAEVTIGGQSIPVDPAWVVTAPPNYAPDLISVRTLWDVIFDAFVQSGQLPAPAKVSFTRHIYPVLRHMCNLQWVNRGFSDQFGWGGPNDFLRPDYLARLSTRTGDTPLTDANAEMRRQVFNALRKPVPDSDSPLPWPWIYGDAMSIPAVSPRQNLALTATQYALFQRWVAGDFEEDFVPDAEPYRSLEEVPLAEQPEMLDRAALWFCLGDAFHPGCEVTWPMRHPDMYMAPFRIRHRPAGEPEPDYGATLTPAVALGPDGPLQAQEPGGLTRWMAVPWQTDTASCRSGYDSQYDPYLPTFWPARVPNHVLTQEDYEIATDSDRPREERLAAFHQRAVWDRGLGVMSSSTYKAVINGMIADFGKLGVVELHPGVKDDAGLPPVMYVETGSGFEKDAAPRTRHLALEHLAVAPTAPAGEEIPALLRHVSGPVGGPAEEAAVVVVGQIDKVKRFPSTR